jgi:hypothetical protein
MGSLFSDEFLKEIGDATAFFIACSELSLGSLPVNCKTAVRKPDSRGNKYLTAILQ